MKGSLWVDDTQNRLTEFSFLNRVSSFRPAADN